MTAAEIRGLIDKIDLEHPRSIPYLLVEIAAQLAEMNAHRNPVSDYSAAAERFDAAYKKLDEHDKKVSESFIELRAAGNAIVAAIEAADNARGYGVTTGALESALKAWKDRVR
jgi:Asp-tRNA(Asn)/Glu-tRNA(Gln) amidotransferase A subunit family amidase